MTRKIRFAPVAAAIVLALGASVYAAPTAKLTVQADQPGPAVSPMLYGIFFEEINCAGDGGLYAELIRNRSFEDARTPEHWSLVTDGAAKGAIDIEGHWPMSAKNPQSLKLTIDSAGQGRVGVANGGYWGIGLQKDAVYTLSLSARAAGFSGPLTVTLENADGKTIYAKTTIGGLTESWKTFKAELTSNGDDPKARLVVSATRPGTIWIDMASLFPKNTWKNRENGMRPDLAEMLTGLKPAFLRFPGGCWVEGETLATAQRWKRTIGPVADRWNQWNIWKYYSTNGLGYHEYLQLSEDLGAEPLFVFNCGMSHAEQYSQTQRLTEAELAEYVQDALDAIEYANGPIDCKWGALRAKAGHPKPFNLKYVEIGNENSGPIYQKRYPVFYNAIKAKYPEMIVIADCPTTALPPDIIDEHYYNNPEFFINNAHKYDSYNRKGPKIYVGEYAVTAGCGQGNLRGAIGEAAFMTGMERNSDVVIMASYAPLFANVNYKKWNPDLINFDSTRLYGLPSYYVQKMFSQNRGDVVLPASLEVTPKITPKPVCGKIGLGAWTTQAEFKDVQVTQGDKVLFQSDFSKGLEGWKPLEGDWKVENGVLKQTGNTANCRIVVGDPAWSNYTLRLKARKIGGAEGFLVLFGLGDENAKCWWNVGGWGNTKHGVEYPNMTGKEAAGKIDDNRWYDLRVELAGHRVRCYLDDKLINEYAVVPPPPPLCVVAGRLNASNEIVLKVVNVSTVAQDTEINIQGVKGIQADAKAIVLTSGNPADENSLAEPTKVAPVDKTIENASENFTFLFPANSVTVLRLKINP